MEDERLILAIGRIERALGRIESATDATLAALVASEQRRRRLAHVAGQVVDDLDRLIGAQG